MANSLRKQIEEVLGYKLPDEYTQVTDKTVIISFGEYGSGSLNLWADLSDMEEALQLLDGYEFYTKRGDDVPNAVKITEGADISKLADWSNTIVKSFEAESGEGENSIYNIDLSDDDELSKIFPFTPTNKELKNLSENKYPKVWEDSEGRGTIAIYELPNKVYMYAFEDAEYFLKTDKNSQLTF